MLVGLQVIHKKHPEPADSEKIAANGPVFETCLRLVQICWGEDRLQVPVGFDYFCGDEAYFFLMEVVCGLQSPVIGETEVFGQFKNFKNREKWSYPLQLVLDNIVADTKSVRDQHLKHLGGQSYGSVIRKHAREHKRVAFIGAGQFTRELLPWIYKEGKSVTIYVRDTSKAQDLLLKYPQVTICKWGTCPITSDVVVVAAPLTSQEIQKNVSTDVSLVMDLRGESQRDSCDSFFKKYRSLDQIFKIIQSHQKQIHSAKEQALEEIRHFTTKRSLFEMMRPFGWDDICVW